MKFSKEQLKFIAERTLNVVTAAIPGAGKTTTIVQKIHHMLAEGSTVVAVTFTKEAADSLRDKTFKSVPVEWQARCLIGTFHGLAKRVLQTHEDSPVRGYKLMDEGKARKQRIIALETAGLEVSPERLAWFEIAFSRLDDPYGLVEARKLAQDDPRRDEAIGWAELRREVVGIYESALKTYRLMDLSRVLLTALEFVRAGHCLFNAKHLLVDEFQDVDQVQLQLIIELEKTMRVDVVGDDDQSIYKFRFGMGYYAFQAIRDALKHSWMTFTLNYRCKPEILHWADLVISRNVHRYRKSLNADREPGGELKLIQLDDEGQENALVANMVYRAVESRVKSVAIIARNNRALVEIQPALTPLVEFRRVSCESMWEQTPCSTVVALLECVAAPDAQVVGLEHALHLFGAHGSEITLMRDITKGRPIQEAFTALRNHAAISEACHEAMHRLSSVLRAVGYPVRPSTAAATDEVLSAVFLEVLDALHFCGNYSNEQRTAFIRMAEAAEKILLNLEGTLAQRLNVVRRALDNKEEGVKVTLTTMHSAKGLEFDSVFIIRASEDVMLGRVSEPEDVEEERRLLYVAMTRARDALTITCARKYGHSHWARPSYMTSLLNVNGSPREDSYEDYAWMLRRR